MKKVNLYAFLIYVIALIAESIFLAYDLKVLIYDMFFGAGLMFINFLLSRKYTSAKSQVILLVINTLYVVWYSWALFDAFHFHRDAQSGLAILFAFVYALPVFVLGWVSAASLNKNGSA
jgi:hypothetical protein